MLRLWFSPILLLLTRAERSLVLRLSVVQFEHCVEIVKKNGKEMLLFDPKDKWAVLRLLDDDYLGSALTGEKYEVTGKRPYQT
jgi:hypothetical protein